MGQDKMDTLLCGVPTLARTLITLDNCAAIDEIIVVTRQEKVVDVAKLCREHNIMKAAKILCGGETRVVSTLAGLSEISPKAQIVAIHDGARPLVTEQIVGDVVNAAALHYAAAPAVIPKDTIKTAQGDIVEQTLRRESTYAIQTPQAFTPELIKAALTRVLEDEIIVTDDCAAVEILGVPVHLVQGDEQNIKLTTPLDKLIIEAILTSRGE